MLAALLPEFLVERIGWLLVHSVWQLTLVSLLLAAVLRMMRRSAPTARYATAVIAWGVMLATPVGTWMLLPSTEARTDIAAQGRLPEMDARGCADGAAHQAAPAAEPGAIAATVPAVAAAARPDRGDAGRSASVAGSAVLPWWVTLEARIAPWLGELVAVWCLGVLVFGLRPIWGWSTVRRLRRRGVAPVPSNVTAILERASRRLGLRRQVQVVQSTLVQVPVVVGYLRPIILLPLSAVSGLSASQVEAVLAHELAHIRRHDFVVNLLQTLSETVLFYHPAVWWVSSRIRHEREHCCDELAATALGSRVEYGRALLALEELRGTAPVLSLSARGGSLVERIRQLAGAEPTPRMSAGGLAAVAASALILVGLGLWSVTEAQERSRITTSPDSAPDVDDIDSAVAADEAESATATAAGTEPAVEAADSARPVAQPIEQNVTVRCIDSEGQPVGGAEVHVFQHNSHQPGRYVHAGPLTADEQGQVTTKAVVRDASGHFDRWVYARVPGRLVGVARSAKWKNRDIINPELNVELQPSRSVEGEVTVPDGFDSTQVLVRVRTMHVFHGSGDFDYESFPRESTFAGLDTALPEIFERRPDADGRVRFSDVPVRGRLYLITVGDGLGEAQWMNQDLQFDEPIALNIEKEGSLTGQVVSADGEPAGGVEILARLSSGGESRAFYLSTFRAVTSPAGEFAIRGLPHTGFVLSVHDPHERWVFRPHENLVIKPGERRSITFQVEPGVRVTGRVADPDGNPVEGAGISAVADNQMGSGLASDGTDADGRYEFRLPSGGARIYFNSLPDGFEYPRPQIVKELTIEPGQAAIEDLDFVLPRNGDSGE